MNNCITLNFLHFISFQNMVLLIVYTPLNEYKNIINIKVNRRFINLLIDLYRIMISNIHFTRVSDVWFQRSPALTQFGQQVSVCYSFRPGVQFKRRH